MHSAIPHQYTPLSSLHITSRQMSSVLDTVCKCCGIKCSICTFEGKELISFGGVRQSTSTGSNTRLESLLIERGDWRATNTSMDILACYNTEACFGRLTGGKATAAKATRGYASSGELYMGCYTSK